MPVYKYNGMECVSAGTLFYRMRAEPEFLFLEKRDKKNILVIEDPGGKSHSDDITIEDTAAREAAEELNGMVGTLGGTLVERVKISQNYIRDLIRAQNACVVHRTTRYAVFLVHLDMPETDFGEYEMHPKYSIYRRAVWLKLSRFRSMSVKNIHPRIRYLSKFL